jgi:hypothetical protein
MKVRNACVGLAVLAGLLVPLTASAQLNGAYLSQFAPGDPQAEAGGTGQVFVVAVEKGGTTLLTVNSSYTHPTIGWTSQVWSYVVVDSTALQAGLTTQIVDSFGVCDNTVRLSLAHGNIVMESLATAPKPDVANPLQLDCADIYPVPLTRTFVPVF